MVSLTYRTFNQLLNSLKTTTTKLVCAYPSVYESGVIALLAWLWLSVSDRSGQTIEMRMLLGQLSTASWSGDVTQCIWALPTSTHSLIHQGFLLMHCCASFLAKVELILGIATWGVPVQRKTDKSFHLPIMHLRTM